MSTDERPTPLDGQDADQVGPPGGSGTPPLIDVLAADARISKAFVMQDVQLESDRERIRARFGELQKAGTVTAAEAAKAIGCNKSTFSQVVSGKYPPNGRGRDRIDTVLKGLDQWMAQRDSIAGAPKRSGFANTRMAEDLRGVAHFTGKLQTIGVVAAQPGTGKTITAQALLSEFAGSILMTIDDQSDTVASFFATLAGILRLQPSRLRAVDRDQCVKTLRNTNRLLMIDEANLAGWRVLNSIRQLHDSTRIPILLLGEQSLLRKIEHGRGDGNIGAKLWSRIGIRVDLEERCRGDNGEPLHSIQDVRKVFAKSKLRLSSDAWEWVFNLSNTPEAGGLRAAQNVLRMTEYVVSTMDPRPHTVDVRLLDQATRNLVGLHRARDVTERIKQRKKVV